MADRQWFIEGVQVYETGEEEFFVEGVQLNEDQAAAAGGFVPFPRPRGLRAGLESTYGGMHG